MEYKPTASSAIEFAKADKLEEWIHLFFCGEGNNKPFSEGLKLKPRKFHAPEMISLGTIKRDCGPEEGMKWRIDENNFNIKINGIIKRYLKNDWDMPPLIVRYDGISFELNDGNHRYEALVRLKIDKYWVIFWEPDI